MPARTFEFKEGSSNKFWNIEHKGNTVTVTYGKIGTAGQTKPKDFPDETAAKKEYDKLIAEKTKKGYLETTAGGGGSAATAVASEPTAAEPVPAAAEKTSKAKGGARAKGGTK